MPGALFSTTVWWAATTRRSGAPATGAQVAPASTEWIGHDWLVASSTLPPGETASAYGPTGGVGVVRVANGCLTEVEAGAWAAGVCSAGPADEHDACGGCGQEQQQGAVT